MEILERSRGTTSWTEYEMKERLSSVEDMIEEIDTSAKKMLNLKCF
jgi:hypothetical protein